MPSRSMQRYVEIAREPPAEREVHERLKDFQEIAARFTEAEAQRQASRCEQCGVPYCHHFCPLHNNIPDWLKLTAEGRFEEAYELAQSTNNLPEICGKICPQDRLCEAKWACTLEQAGHGTVTIGAVEQFLGDIAWEKGWVKPRRPRQERSEHVAIVGAGPAGMAAAEELRAKGYQVSVFDRQREPGGLLRYGIPGFKLEKSAIKRRTDLILQAGVRFIGGFELGRTAALADLQKEYAAVLLALGAYRPKRLQLVGAEKTAMIDGLSYLLASMDEPEVVLPSGIAAENGKALARGRHVAVIGGGDTAMDCLRTALRQGAASVTCIYRRGEWDRPGSWRELEKAEKEGVEFLWNAETRSIQSQSVSMIEGNVHSCVGGSKATLFIDQHAHIGREAYRLCIEADFLIAAIGSEPALPKEYGAPGLATNHKGALVVESQTGATNIPGVFAAGDLARGPSLAVWAIRDGRTAANGIHRFLTMQATHERSLAKA